MDMNHQSMHGSKSDSSLVPSAMSEMCLLLGWVRYSAAIRITHEYTWPIGEQQ